MQSVWTDGQHDVNMSLQHEQTSPLSDNPSTTSMPSAVSPSPQHNEQTGPIIIEEDDLKVVTDLAETIVAYCKEHNVEDPVDILRYFQKIMVEGRALRIQDSGRIEEGDTNFILVDRFKILETALEEVKSLENLRKTLEVQFYGEVSPLLHYMYCAIYNSILDCSICYPPRYRI